MNNCQRGSMGNFDHYAYGNFDQVAFGNKVQGAGEACRRQGIAFLPMAVESFGGWHEVSGPNISPHQCSSHKFQLVQGVSNVCLHHHQAGEAACQDSLYL